MRKNVFGRQLKRDSNERKALFKGLISSLILHERIKTTEEKAKSIRPLADKIITTAKSDLATAKKGEKMARRLLQRYLPQNAIDKLIFKIAPRFENRKGGYTRIVKIGRRFSDNASLVLLEWTEQDEVKSKNLEVKSMDEKTAIAESQIKAEAQKITTKETQSRGARSGSARKKTEAQKRKRVKTKR